MELLVKHNRFSLPSVFKLESTPTNVRFLDLGLPLSELSYRPEPAGQDRSLRPGRALAGASRKRASARPNSQQTGGRVFKGTVLVVDDVLDVTEMIALFLTHAGYDVTTANSADAALQLAERKHFDLVISDIGMPEMNGYELAEALRSQTKYRSTPLIAVTGYTEYDDRGRSLRAGFDAHLTKPINPSQLLDLIGELLGPV